jgi:hypothetical protein
MEIEIEKVVEPKFVLKIDDAEFEMTKDQAETLRDMLCDELGTPQSFKFVYRVEPLIRPPYTWTCAVT